MAFCWLGGRIADTGNGTKTYEFLRQGFFTIPQRMQGAFRTIRRRYKEIIVCGQFPKNYALLDSAAAV